MDPLYLMQALGLDTPILEAIHGNLFSTHVFRSIFSFFLELGFSLVHSETIPQIAHTEYTFAQAGRRNITCHITVSHDGRHVFAIATSGENIYKLTHTLEYKEDQTELSLTHGGFGFIDKSNNNETMLELWKERVIKLTQIANEVNTMNNNIFG